MQISLHLKIWREHTRVEMSESFRSSHRLSRRSFCRLWYFDAMSLPDACEDATISEVAHMHRTLTSGADVTFRGRSPSYVINVLAASGWNLLAVFNLFFECNQPVRPCGGHASCWAIWCGASMGTSSTDHSLWLRYGLSDKLVSSLADEVPRNSCQSLNGCNGLAHSSLLFQFVPPFPLWSAPFLSCSVSSFSFHPSVFEPDHRLREFSNPRNPTSS